MADKNIEIVAKLKDEISTNIKKIQGSFKDLDNSTKGAGAGLRDIKRETKGAQGGFIGMTGSILKANIAFAAIEKSIGFVKDIGTEALTAADQFEKGQLKYKVLLGSQEAALERISELQAFAAKTPFEFQGIQKADVLLQGFGIRSKEILTTIGDAAAISGSDFADLSLVIGQLSQSKDLENIKQLVERGVVSFQELKQAGIEFGKDGSVQNSVEQTYTAVLDIMKNKFGGGMDELSGTMSGKISTLKDSITLALGQIAQDIGAVDLFKGILDQGINLANMITGGGEGGGDFLSKIFKPETIETVRGLMDTFMTSMNTAFETLQPKLQAIQEAMGPFFTQMQEGFIKIAPVLDLAIQLLVEGFTRILDTVLTVAPNIMEIVSSAFNVIGDAIQFVVNIINGDWSAAFNSLASMGEGILNIFRNAAEGTFTIVDNMTGGLLSKIAGFITEGVAKFASFVADGVTKFNDFKSRVTAAITGLAADAVAKFNNLKSQAIAAIVGLISNAVTSFNNMKAQALSVVQGLVSAVIEKFNSLRGMASSAIGGVVSVISGFGGSFVSIGTNLIQGLWNGMSGKLSALTSWVSGRIEGLKNTVKSVLQIASPSRWAIQIGQFVGEGLRIGMTSSIALAAQAANSGLQSLKSSVTSQMQQIKQIAQGAGGGLGAIMGGRNKDEPSRFGTQSRTSGTSTSGTSNKYYITINIDGKSFGGANLRQAIMDVLATDNRLAQYNLSGI